MEYSVEMEELCDSLQTQQLWCDHDNTQMLTTQFNLTKMFLHRSYADSDRNRDTYSILRHVSAIEERYRLYIHYKLFNHDSVKYLYDIILKCFNASDMDIKMTMSFYIDHQLLKYCGYLECSESE